MFQYAQNNARLSNIHSPAQACLPLLKRSPGSRLINVTSVASRQPCPGLSVYTATKHALAGFSEVSNITYNPVSKYF